METEPCRKKGLGQSAMSLLLIICGKEGSAPHTLFLVIFLTFSFVSVLQKVSVHGRNVASNSEVEIEHNRRLKISAELPAVRAMAGGSSHSAAKPDQTTYPGKMY